ncbi:helix-turn-helix domain-containing protein [uncultured Arcticibacterium sp.]|uniref:helix-turn-helix domain-containing protein n=1 Tax=uncultured Arcticibacterium sp. TaxID=2173042 RepID=UPI0030FAECF9
MKALVLNGVEVDDLLAEIRHIVQQEMLQSSSSEQQEEVEWLDIKQASTFIKKATQTVYQYCSKDSKSSIPHYRKYGKLYFKKAELEDWLMQGKRGGNSQDNSWK